MVGFGCPVSVLLLITSIDVMAGHFPPASHGLAPTLLRLDFFSFSTLCILHARQGLVLSGAWVGLGTAGWT